MMKFAEYKNKILNEISLTLDAVSEEKVDELTEAIRSAGRIFVDGAGRSGYMMRCFAMRLMHIGFCTYFLGETVTPGAREKDILIVGSGSGETGSLVARAKKARKIGCKIAVITISGCCSLGSLADWVIEIPAPTAKIETEYKSIQPMGNLFEQALLLTCEIMIMKIMEKTGISSDEMFKNHANLE